MKSMWQELILVEMGERENLIKFRILCCASGLMMLVFWADDGANIE